MGLLKFVIKANRVLRTTLILLLSSFLAVAIFGVTYIFLQRTWQNPGTWSSELFYPAFAKFPGIKFYSVLNNKTGTLEVSAKYAVLYKMERNNKKIKYYFSFTPYSVIENELKKIPPNSLKKRLQPDFIFTLPDVEKYKPFEFLDHKLLTVDSYTTFFVSDPVAVPVRFSFKVDIREFLRPSVKNLFKHAYIVYIKKQKEALPEKLLEWKIARIPFADKYFSSNDKEKYKVYLDKWSEAVFDWYTSRIKGVLHKYDITQKEGRARFFNSITDLFDSPYQKCSLKKCSKEGEVSPGAPYLLYLYGLYYRDPDLFAVLKEATYKYFTNYHPDYIEGSKNDKWGLIVPYIAPVAPVGLADKDVELKELFVDTYTILAQRIEKPLAPARILSITKDAKLPLLGWSDQDFIWAVGDSNLAAYYKYTKGALYLPKGTYQGLSDNSRNLLTLLLKTRIIGNAKNSSEKKMFLLSYPKDEKKFAYFVYNATEFNPYKSPFLQRHRELVVDVESLDEFDVLQDKVLSLLLAYEESITR